MIYIESILSIRVFVFVDGEIMIYKCSYFIDRKIRIYR